MKNLICLFFGHNDFWLSQAVAGRTFEWAHCDRCGEQRLSWISPSQKEIWEKEPKRMAFIARTNELDAEPEKIEINGEVFLIEKGKEVEVPASVAEALWKKYQAKFSATPTEKPEMEFDKRIPERTMNEDNPQYVLGWNACRYLCKKFISQIKRSENFFECQCPPILKTGVDGYFHRTPIDCRITPDEIREGYVERLKELQRKTQRITEIITNKDGVIVDGAPVEIFPKDMRNKAKPSTASKGVSGIEVKPPIKEPKERV